MANHVHKQIRDAVKTALTGLATTGSRVWTNRLQVMQDADLPGLRIYADEETAADLSMHAPGISERQLTLVVEAVAKAVSGLDDTLDQVAKEVETVLAGTITVSGKTLDIAYTGMRFDDEPLDKPVGVKRMTFTVSFYTAANAPDVLI